MKTKEDIIKNIHSTFANVATSLGYSEVHGMVVSALFAEDKPISLQELSKKTGYSLASISISLDLLELMGVVKKIKNIGDRKVYVKLEGDLLEILKQAFMFRVKKSTITALSEFEQHKASGDEKTKKLISMLEKEVRRLDKYIDNLAKVNVPEK